MSAATRYAEPTPRTPARRVRYDLVACGFVHGLEHAMLDVAGVGPVDCFRGTDRVGRTVEASSSAAGIWWRIEGGEEWYPADRTPFLNEPDAVIFAWLARARAAESGRR